MLQITQSREKNFIVKQNLTSEKGYLDPYKENLARALS